MATLTALENKIKEEDDEDKQYLAIEDKLVIVDNNNRENENLISLYKYIDNELKNPEKQETYFKFPTKDKSSSRICKPES